MKQKVPMSVEKPLKVRIQMRKKMLNSVPEKFRTELDARLINNDIAEKFILSRGLQGSKEIKEQIEIELIQDVHNQKIYRRDLAIQKTRNNKESKLNTARLRANEEETKQIL